MITLSAPPDFVRTHLTDEQYKDCIPCYCDRCGTQLWMHILFPRVGGLAMEHACVAKNPERHLIRYKVIEMKPMDMPSGEIFKMDYTYPHKYNHSFIKKNT